MKVSCTIEFPEGTCERLAGWAEDWPFEANDAAYGALRFPAVPSVGDKIDFDCFVFCNAVVTARNFIFREIGKPAELDVTIFLQGGEDEISTAVNVLAANGWY